MNETLFPNDEPVTERTFVADLAPNQRVEQAFVVKEKTLAPFRNKPGQYLNLLLADRTGDIKARAWDNAAQVDALLTVGAVARIHGHVEEYQGQRQFIVKAVEPLEEGRYDPADFVAASRRPREEMLAQLRDDLNAIVDPCLEALARSFFEDPEFLDAFVLAPGAKTLHHSFVGGLLEHTLAVVEVCKCAATIHPELNRDLLIAGGLLHDIGKVWELHSNLVTEYTDEGQLLGHIVLTDRAVTERIAQIPDFPLELANQLTHILLSHHGERQWGAPVVPATLEACALHYADNLDAHIQGFKQVVAQVPADSNWSEYHRVYERRLYAGSRNDASGQDSQ